MNSDSLDETWSIFPIKTKLYIQVVYLTLKDILEGRGMITNGRQKSDIQLHISIIECSLGENNLTSDLSKKFGECIDYEYLKQICLKYIKKRKRGLRKVLQDVLSCDFDHIFLSGKSKKNHKK